MLRDRMYCYSNLLLSNICSLYKRAQFTLSLALQPAVSAEKYPNKWPVFVCPVWCLKGTVSNVNAEQRGGDLEGRRQVPNRLIFRFAPAVNPLNTSADCFI